MKTISKKLAIIISTILVVSTFTGCGSSKKADSVSSSDKGIAIKDPVNLSVEVFDRSNAPSGGGTADNNWLTKQIQTKFGTPNKITIKYVTLPRSEEVAKLNILMASNSAPDIVMSYNQNLFFNYASQGGLTDLTALYNKATNLKTFEGDNINYGKYSGKIYSIPAKRSVVAKHVDMIRQDLLDKVGMKSPTTSAEFEAVLKAFKGLGNGIIPYGLVNSGTNALDLEYGTDHLIKSFVDPVISDQDQQTIPDIKWKGYKEGVQFLNKLYNEGLIDTEFALDQNDTKLKANITTGKIAFYDYDNDTQWGGADTSLEATLEKNVPGASFVPVDTFKNSNGKYMHSIYTSNGMYIMVPKTAKSPEAAMKYLDWMATADAGKLMNWGAEGVEYTLDANGLPDQSKADKNIVKTQFWNHGDLAILYSGVFAPTIDKVYQMMAKDTNNYGKYGDIVVKSTQMSQVDSYIDYSKIPIFDKPIDASIKYQNNLDTLYATDMVKCIMAKTGNFSKVYDDMVSQYMSNGGQEIQDAKIAAYKLQHNK